MPERSERNGDAPLSNGNLAVVDLSSGEFSARAIETELLGELEVPSGRLVADDPLSDMEQPPFVRAVPPGRYPVTLYRADFRVALASIRFAPGLVDYWELARLPGRGLAHESEPEESHCHFVDSARSCFMDAEAAAAKQKRAKINHENGDHGDYVGEILDSGDHIHQPLKDERLNVAIFESGEGDGTYHSYWGLNDAGQPLVLVTDFQFIKNADGRVRSSS